MTIIRRHFVYHEDEDSGIDGWASMFVPKSAGFAPNHGRGLVHDALEHGLNEDGSFAFEAIAFGRILAMRRGLITNPRALGSELYDTWQSDAEGAHFEAPCVGRCAASEDIQEVVAGFARAWFRDSEKGVIQTRQALLHRARQLAPDRLSRRNPPVRRHQSVRERRLRR